MRSYSIGQAVKVCLVLFIYLRDQLFRAYAGGAGAYRELAGHAVDVVGEPRDGGPLGCELTPLGELLELGHGGVEDPTLLHHRDFVRWIKTQVEHHLVDELRSLGTAQGLLSRYPTREWRDAQKEYQQKATVPGHHELKTIS